MDTSPSKEVKAPPHDGTPRSDQPVIQNAGGRDLFSHVRSWSSRARSDENHWPSDGRIQENSVPLKV